MPGEVSDLRDVVDAINRLCDNMKTSSYDDNDICEPENETEFQIESIHKQPETPRYEEFQGEELVNPEEINVQKVETYSSENWSTEIIESAVHEEISAQKPELFTPMQAVESYSSEPSVCNSDSSIQKADSSETSSLPKAESNGAEKWSDTTSHISLPGQVEDVETDTEPAGAQCEPPSEMYYTASSEISLLSDLEGPEKPAEVQDSERKEVVAIAGHVAAMRERFESMTRANTPCPDLMRSVSPSYDWGNATSSPDHLAG